ncbi:MAG: hypothetical protein HY320_09530 [Armatimonadetes bacterium]|nr:hypothetical protein [Armatimonadota bacterium]
MNRPTHGVGTPPPGERGVFAGHRADADAIGSGRDRGADGGAVRPSRKLSGEEIARLRLVDVVLPTRIGIELCKRSLRTARGGRCVTRPEKHEAIRLQRLGLRLPERISIHSV